MILRSVSTSTTLAGILYLVTSWVTACSAGDNLLDNSRLMWELTPAGYLEPIVPNENSIATYAESFSDAQLMDAATHPNRFATAYVLLRAKYGATSRMPAEKTSTGVRAEHGELIVAVQYIMTDRGLTKVVTYPNVAIQLPRVSRDARILVERKSAVRTARFTVPAFNGSDPAIELPEHISIRIGTVNLYKSVYVDPALHASMLVKWSESPTTVLKQLQEQDDWIGRHVLLSQVLFPDSYSVRSTRNGFHINANGLRVQLNKVDGQYVINYPSLEHDRALITEFWSAQARDAE